MEIGDRRIERFCGEVSELALEFAERLSDHFHYFGGFDRVVADRMVDIRIEPPKRADIVAIEILARLEMDRDEKSVFRIFTALFELLFDVQRYPFDIIDYLFGVPEHVTVDTL